jgi:hypothetical protein
MPTRYTRSSLDLMKTESAEFYVQASTCTLFERLQAITCNRSGFFHSSSDDVYHSLLTLYFVTRTSAALSILQFRWGENRV